MVPWTRKQRLGLSALLIIILVGIGVRIHSNPSRVPDPQPALAARAGEVLNRVDPNTADAAALSALPMIGPAMAARIVADREQFFAGQPGVAAYRKLEDLLRVKGIGPATLQAIEPYLTFGDAIAATTIPAVEP